MALANIKMQEIVEAMKTRFGGIVASEDYHTTLNNRVYVNKTSAIGSELHPCINIWEREGMVHQSVGQDTIVAEIEIDFHSSVEDGGIEVRKMKADLLKTVATDVTWGGKATDTVLVTSTGPRYNNEDIKKSEGSLKLRLTYRTEAWQI